MLWHCWNQRCVCEENRNWKNHHVNKCSQIRDSDFHVYPNRSLTRANILVVAVPLLTSASWLCCSPCPLMLPVIFNWKWHSWWVKEQYVLSGGEVLFTFYLPKIMSLSLILAHFPPEIQLHTLTFPSLWRKPALPSSYLLAWIEVFQTELISPICRLAPLPLCHHYEGGLNEEWPTKYDSQRFFS